MKTNCFIAVKKKRIPFGEVLLAATICAALLTPSARAQFQWSQRIASVNSWPEGEFDIGMALDTNGNCYVTGMFDGTNNFGGITLTNQSVGGSDIFVAKYNTNGALQWAQRAGGNSINYGRMVGVDTNGNVYITGGFSGPAKFGSVNLTGASGESFFLAKYNNSGVVQWVQPSAGGTTNVYGIGLAVDGAGNSYALVVVDWLHDQATSITFGSTTVPIVDAYGESPVTILVKYDNTGTVKWALLLDGSDEVYARKVVLDATGNVYVGGTFVSTLTIGNSNLVGSADSTRNLFIAKFTNSGNTTWIQQPKGISGVGGMAVDLAGNVYVSGEYETNVNFGGGINLTNAGSFDAFLAKYNSSGVIQWAKSAGGDTSPGAYVGVYGDVALDGQTNVYTAGFLNSSAVVAKYNPAGTLQWTYSASGTSASPFSSLVNNCAMDSSTNCFLAGWYQGTNTFGTNVLQPQEVWNFFLAKLSSSLAVNTTALSGGTTGVAYNQTLTAYGGQPPYSWTNISGAFPPGLALATNGVISGTPTTNGTFNFTVKVTDALSSTATQALSLTVVGPPSVTIQPTNNSVSVTVGSNVTFSVSVSGTGPFSYQWQLNGTNLPNGIITTVAGNGTNGYFGDGGAATNAELSYIRGAAVDATGNLFIADANNERIREVRANGIITTVAGNGTNGYFGDGGAATNAELSYPDDVVVDAIGNLFIVDHSNQRIRKVGTNGIITTVAGNGTNGYSGDGGAATNAELSYPNGVAVDATGNLFVADYDNQRIRKVGTNGIITTVAGNGTNGYSGDGGTATNAELYFANGVAVDATGNLFIADSVNFRIRKVGVNGIITTVAGNSTWGYSGDGGAATNAELDEPVDVAVDATGNLFVADVPNDRIREVGTNGVINTVAGNGYINPNTGGGGYSGDGGAATNAELYWPYGVAVDATGNLFIADTYNNRIRKVVFQGPTLVLNDVELVNAGTYDVVVSSPYGSVTSSVVNLIITLPPVILSAPQVTGGNTNFTFLLSGPAGSNYVLQVSTNLLNWNPVSTSTIPVSGSINLTNAISGYNRRFYQVYLQ